MTDEIITSADVSQNRVWGHLGTTSVADVLDSCRRRRLTGEVTFRAGDDIGVVELRAGSIERAEVRGRCGDAALAVLDDLREGTFEVVQRLPDFGGQLGDAAEFLGEIAAIPLIQVMRHVEQHALSVTLTVIHDFDRGVIRYRDGEIVGVELNGDRDLDRIGDILRFGEGKYRVSASPLELALPARRAPRRLPTEPFHVGHVRGMVLGEHDDSCDVDEPEPAPARLALLDSWLGRQLEPHLHRLHQRAQQALDHLGRLVGA